VTIQLESLPGGAVDFIGVGFWKTIITTLIPHLLGWPVAAVVLGLIFKNQVSTLLARLKNFSAKHGSTSLDIETVAAAAEQKIEKGDVTVAGSLSLPTTQSPLQHPQWRLTLRLLLLPRNRRICPLGKR